MKILSKADIFSPAFELKDGGVIVKTGVIFDQAAPANPFVALPIALAPGVDYSIHEGLDGELQASTARIDGELGGFHVGLDGQIVVSSIWDTKFRPACVDPRGMVYVSGFWADIYLLNTDSTAGTSRPGVSIARNITWWDSVELLAAQGKQLLSVAEFSLAAKGVTQGKTAGTRPESTGHVDELRSTVGLEQATGCMWTWGRDFDPTSERCAILGGDWFSAGAGSRRLLDCGAGLSFDSIGARGRCDHLTLA